MTQSRAATQKKYNLNRRQLHVSAATKQQLDTMRSFANNPRQYPLTVDQFVQALLDTAAKHGLCILHHDKGTK